MLTLFQAMASQQRSVLVPPTLVVNRSGVINMGVRVISSTGDLSVVGLHKFGTSCGASPVFPVASLGREYYAITWWPGEDAQFKTPQVLVAGVDDNTQVTVTFPSGRPIRVTYNGVVYNSGRPLVFQLNRWV